MVLCGRRAAAGPPLAETFEIGLSTETISVGTNFGGSRLVVFGALDNADQRLLRQGRYDIVVILEGPRRDIVVREKERTLGLWINRAAERFDAVPSSYSLVSTRPLRDIAPAVTLRQLDIGVENLEFDAPGLRTVRPERKAEFSEAVKRLGEQGGLYTQTTGGIDFVSATLFRANLQLPADLPVGRHVARAILFARASSFAKDRRTCGWSKRGSRARYPASRRPAASSTGCWRSPWLCSRAGSAGSSSNGTDRRCMTTFPPPRRAAGPSRWSARPGF